MFQYEYEKRPSSANSCSSRATMTTDWSRVYPGRGYSSKSTSACVSVERARRPLPPRPISCNTLPTKTTVPLKVWIIASASCFAVCAALVLATVMITKWGTTDTYTRHEVFSEAPEPIYSSPHPKAKISKVQPTTTTTEADIQADKTLNNDLEEELQIPILEKISIFKNIVANRDKNKKAETKNKDITLISKPQIHPVHDTTVQHAERKIEKKDQAIYPLHLDIKEIPKQKDAMQSKKPIPDFKPTLPDVIKVVDGYVTNLRKAEVDYEEYYNDENLYDDYMQSNSMTSYLIEKVQELHDWINTDPDFEAHNVTKKRTGNEFSQLLKALNESLVEGNVTIIMNKLRDIYFGDNYTSVNHTRKVISGNSTDLLSFGILSLDIMLLHNIQLMAWENQEAARNRMLKDPEVFAFNALFLEPSKVEAKQNEVYHHDNSINSKRQNLREPMDEYDFGRNLLENVLEIGMSTARAAIHLGRAYKNTKLILTQLSNKESLNANIQNQIARNSDANTHALQHLRTSFDDRVASSVASTTNTTEFTELDCLWWLYCKNLVATAKLNPPYGTMARINGMALRMLTGELSADKALDTMLYEALTGWTELRCSDMFPKCSKGNAASVVMESILQPLRKSQSTNSPR